MWSVIHNESNPRSSAFEANASIALGTGIGSRTR